MRSICGHVGCCDSSNFHATTHPIAQSIEPEEDWRWGYVDQAFV